MNAIGILRLLYYFSAHLRSTVTVRLSFSHFVISHFYLLRFPCSACFCSFSYAWSPSEISIWLSPNSSSTYTISSKWWSAMAWYHAPHRRRSLQFSLRLVYKSPCLLSADSPGRPGRYGASPPTLSIWPNLSLVIPWGGVWISLWLLLTWPWFFQCSSRFSPACPMNGHLEISYFVDVGRPLHLVWWFYLLPKLWHFFVQFF